MKILVDADACPKTVLNICFQIGSKYTIPVWTVASYNHNIISDNHIVVGGQSQEADIKLINMTCPGDIVITQDWGLASMVLGRSAYCISPHGREYRLDNIEFLLEEREIKAKLRRGGGKTKGPSKRKDADDHKFAEVIERVIMSVKY